MGRTRTSAEATETVIVRLTREELEVLIIGTEASRLKPLLRPERWEAAGRCREETVRGASRARMGSMNLSRDKAVQAMDAINAAGFTAVIEAAVIPSHSREVLYRVSLPMLSTDSENMRTLCDLAESLGLTCRHQLQRFTFVLPDDYPKGLR